MLEHERYVGLGMDDLVNAGSCTMNVIMFLGMGARVIGCAGSTTVFGHGCFGNPMSLQYESCHGLGVDVLVTAGSCSRSVIVVGRRTHWERKTLLCLCMHALVTGCSCNSLVFMVWAWVRW